MASSINASTSGAGGVITTADNTGILNIQTGGTTVAAVSSTGLAVTGTLSASGATTLSSTLGVTGDLSFNSGYGSAAVAYGCRAWVKFNGTGTVAINGSGNVSSITDVSVGTYKINFTNAMPDANYSMSVVGRPTTDVVCTPWIAYISYGDYTTSLCTIRFADQSPATIDPNIVCVSVFR